MGDGVNEWIEANESVNQAHAHSRDTLLIAACCFKHEKAVKALLDADADPNLCNVNGSTPLMFPCGWELPYNSTIFDSLIDAGAEIDTRDKSGWTAFATACYCDIALAAISLAQLGCDVKIPKDLLPPNEESEVQVEVTDAVKKCAEHVLTCF